MNKIYLASNSPRRWALLQELGIELEQLQSEVDESPKENELAHDYCLRIALEKNQAAQAVRLAENFEDFPILTADTTVSIDNRILGKPKDKADARTMLELLSGRIHQVFTAVCVSFKGQTFSCVQTNDVEFKSLSETEIDAYVESGIPFDKAGAYGIQGVGGVFIKHLSGSYTGVMGLPVYETVELLAKCGILVKF